MENDSVLVEMKGIVECFKKECIRYENIRQIYLESSKSKGEDSEWVHERMEWLYGLMNPRFNRYMGLQIYKLKIPNKDKNYLWNLLQFQSLLNNFDPVIDNAERIITLSM
jgi:hypothetical protein